MTEMMEDAKNANCRFDRRQFYVTDDPEKVQKMKLYAFCLLDSTFEQKFGKQAPNWVQARGEFNPPSKVKFFKYLFKFLYCLIFYSF